MNPIPYGRQTITETDKQAVMDVLEGPFLTQGPFVEKFETAVKTFVEAPYACAVTNGTAALHLSAMALGVSPGDKVLVSTNTFVASANCIRYCGGEVEFVDNDPDTYCLDLNLLEKKLSSAKPGTYKGIVSVDFAGYPVNLEKLRGLADQYGLWILEDSCHSIGGEFRNSKGEWIKCGSGRYAEMAIFSFHPVKHVATGEGGMIMTARKNLWDQVMNLRTHGITRDPERLQRKDGPWYYEMQTLGYNYRMPDILCALGASQMTRIEKNIERRRQIAATYYRELEGLPLKLPQVPSDVKHAYHLFVIQTEKRDQLYAHLKNQGVNCQVHYIPVHTQPYYVERYGRPELPVAEKYYAQALSIPMFHGMTDDEQTHVIREIKTFFKA